VKPSDLIPKRIIDPKAETALEIQKQCLRGRKWVDDYCKNMVSLGKWEQVWKHTGNRLVPAFRVKAK
jgi:hypothetical protein